MELEGISPLQASEKWGISERQVQSLCLQGKVIGATKFSKLWLIPKDAQH
ncbi:MAG: helix-turn-helix domain-containing protein [Defluviitaleaceae bacterium]|nr:helix-turn-helix domain-containing protein [Defluviitaleaceae bacterium]